MKIITTVLAAMALLTGCVPTSQLKESQAESASLRAENARLTSKVSDLESNIAQLKSNITELKSNIAQLKSNVAGQNDQIAGLSGQNAALGQESANEQNKLNQSQGNLRIEQAKLVKLENLLAQQRAQSDALKNKMAEALNGFKSSDLTVTEKNGKVYVTLSENLLFASGSASVSSSGSDALAKLAAVLNVNPDIAIDIEGHTDSIPMHGRYQDNWDLSTSRADAIVRILINNYGVNPAEVIASGHSKFDPIDTNTTPDGRAKNRRTEIILSPKLDEMYKLLAAS